MRRFSILFAAILFGGIAMLSSDSAEAKLDDGVKGHCSGSEGSCMFKCPSCGAEYAPAGGGSYKGEGIPTGGTCRCGHNFGQ